MRPLTKLGLGALLAGVLLYVAGEAVGSFDVSMVGVMAFAGGMAVLYLDNQKYYCEACGQVLGRDKPDRCTQCGSNRFTTKDPGAGKAVRVTDDRRSRR